MVELRAEQLADGTVVVTVGLRVYPSVELLAGLKVEQKAVLKVEKMVAWLDDCWDEIWAGTLVGVMADEMVVKRVVV